MRVFLIKRKGSTTWYNMLFDKVLTFSDGKMISTGKLFFRRKDAIAYLQAMEDSIYYEVIGATIDKK